MKHLKWLAVCLGVAVGPGCYSSAGYYDPYYYDYVYYDPYYYGYDTYYTYSWVDPIYDDFYYYARGSGGGTSLQQTLDLNAIANKIATNLPNYYGSCAMGTPSGATVTIVYSNCTSQFGLTAVNGTVLLSLAESAGQLTITGKSTNLTVGGEPYNLDLTATAPTSGNPVLQLNSRSFSPSRMDSRQNQTTVSWVKGSNCFDVNGQGQITRGDLSATSTIAGYHRCIGQCPSSGTVTVNTPGGTFSGTFDGSDKLVVTAPDGQPKNYDLTCQ